jgi:hypothetical protein
MHLITPCERVRTPSRSQTEAAQVFLHDARAPRVEINGGDPVPEGISNGRETLCRTWFLETCAVEHCRLAACVEKPAVRDTALWRRLLT